MVQSMRSVVAEGTVAYESAERADWVLQWPGQVVLAVTAIYWTQVSAGASGAFDTKLGSRSPRASPCPAQFHEQQATPSQLSPPLSLSLSELGRGCCH